MTNRILVPFDGSMHARRALGLACGLARAGGGALLLVHVVGDRALTDEERRLVEAEHLAGAAADPELGGPVEGAADTALIVSRVMRHYPVAEAAARMAIGTRILEDGAAAARAQGVTPEKTLLREGDAAAEIARVAREENVDHVVMGARGLGTLAGLVLGSVSQKVIHLVPCTCTVVK